jgi:predicted esterase
MCNNGPNSHGCGATVTAMAVRRGPRAALLVTAVAAVLLSACGGGDERSVPIAAANDQPRVYGEGADAVWAFLPRSPPRSLVVFLHGHGGPRETTPANHRSWIEHLTTRGNVVLFPRYEVEPGGHDAVRHIDAAVATAREEIDLDGLPTVVFGYSRGGRLAVDWAAEQVDEPPAAVFSVFPASSEDGETDLVGLDPSTRVFLLVGEEDEVVGFNGAEAILRALTRRGFPESSIRVELVRTTRRFVASHLSLFDPAARDAFWPRGDALVDEVRAAAAGSG